MSLPARIRPDAAEDIEQAYEWYEAQLLGLGDTFVENVDAALEAISYFPRMHPATYRDVRQSVVKRFLYVVHYRAQIEEIEVIAIMHGHRHSRDWRMRIDA